MNRLMNGIVGTLIVCGVLIEMGTVRHSSAAVRVGVNINLGAPIIVESEPPEVIVVPGSAVCFVPRDDFDIFFYGGFWWSPRGERWYRARAYNGPWGVVQRRFVPGPVFGVPRDFRVRYMRAERTPYPVWKKRWIRERSPQRVEVREDRGGRGDRGDKR